MWQKEKTLENNCEFEALCLGAYPEVERSRCLARDKYKCVVYQGYVLEQKEGGKKYGG